jgi:hypothetical protein
MLKTTLFTPRELQTYYNDNKVMFFTRFAVQQLHYSVNAGYSFTKVFTFTSPFCKRGTFCEMTTATASAYIPEGAKL